MRSSKVSVSESNVSGTEYTRLITCAVPRVYLLQPSMTTQKMKQSRTTSFFARSDELALYEYRKIVWPSTR
jgi:hypothetical protein